MNKCFYLFAACAAAGLAFAPSGVRADGSGVYAGVAAGVALRGKDDTKTTVAGIKTDSAAEYDPAAAFAGYAGYDFGKMRADLEVRYAASGVDSISSADSAGGNVSNLAVLANAYYDIETGAKITPYVGAGLGLAVVSADITSRLGGVTTKVDDSDTVFAGQGIVGASYPLNDRVSLAADYRIMYTAAPSFSGKTGPVDASVDGESGLSHHFLLGVRMKF